MTIRLAVDAMGGDLGVAATFPAALLALKKHPSLHLSLFVEADVSPPAQLLAHPRATVIPCGKSISEALSPMRALRSQRESSMAMALSSLAAKDVQGVVSSGDTGALLGFAMKSVGTIEPLKRPALCASFPNGSGRTWFLDLGANLEPSIEQLVQLARMGSCQSRLMDGIESPKIGLLNVGTEDHKGTPDVRAAAERLVADQSINFCGYAEGRDLFSSKFDVVVCDGFAGNIALKTAEGVAVFLVDQLKKALHDSLVARLCLWMLRAPLRHWSSGINPIEYNGAPLLGLNALVVKSHGASDKLAFLNAIDVAVSMVTCDLVGNLQQVLPEGLNVAPARAF